MKSQQGQRSTEPPARVLVVRLGAVGDVVRTLPAVRLLKRRWPKCRLGWVVEDGALPLLDGHPDVDQVLHFKRRRLGSLMPGSPLQALRLLAGLRGELREFAADLSLDFQSSLKSGIVSMLSGASRRVGFDRPFDREASHIFANQRVRLAEARIHRVQRAAQLVLAAGVEPGTLTANLALKKHEKEAARAHLDALRDGRKVVLLAPFSSKRQAWKRYPLDRWAEISRRLASEQVAVIVLAGPGEEREVRELSQAGGPLVKPCGDLNLRELSALISCAPVLVGGDTGPMHLGWAGGARVIAIYGPTDPVLNAPFGDGHVILAPEQATGRKDEDRFPGITPEIVADHALRLVMETSQ